MSGKASQEWPGLSGVNKRFAIVASRFNHEVVEKLVEGARRALWEYGVDPGSVDVYWCPGALEIPALARRLARQTDNHAPRYHGIVCCGAVVRGETDHYQFVATEAMHGVSALAGEANIAVGNAILTVANLQQAWDRARDDTSNKGYEAAIAALVMAQLFEKLD
ncbi:MAG: 6,7-dimethyl-8-ribityllumazine synthase [Candidatus Sumerlaeaceae bacterium]|nr:6,7-dimethyl-8-ribityllumazine synthase [Candidatus Sumerlaeaceae bacterium]